MKSFITVATISLLVMFSNVTLADSEYDIVEATSRKVVSQILSNAQIDLSALLYALINDPEGTKARFVDGVLVQGRVCRLADEGTDKIFDACLDIPVFVDLVVSQLRSLSREEIRKVIKEESVVGLILKNYLSVIGVFMKKPLLVVDCARDVDEVCLRKIKEQ